MGTRKPLNAYRSLFLYRSSMPANRLPQRCSTKESSTVWWESPRSRDLFPSGGATWPTSSGTSLPKPLTLLLKTSTRRSSSAAWIRRHSSGDTSLGILRPAAPLVQLPFVSCTPSTSPEQGSPPTSARVPRRGNSPALETASPRSSKPTASRGFTSDSTCPFRASSSTEPLTSAASTQPKVRVHFLSELCCLVVKSALGS